MSAQNPQPAPAAPHATRKKTELESMDIERAESGGFVMRHRFNSRGGESYMPPETHVAATSDELHAHIAKHFGHKLPGAASKGAGVD